MTKLDLNKLREEIDKEKQNKNIVPSRLGENSMPVNSGAPRDEFLHGLVASLNTGQASASSNLLKEVHNTVVEKKGGDKSINPTAAPTQPSNRGNARQNQVQPVNMSQDREQQMYNDFQKMKTNTLAESIEQFSGGQQVNGQQSTMTNFNGQQYLTSIPNNAQQPMNNAPMQMNEAAVKGVVNNYLSENLGTVFEEAIKGTIIEMYAVERIKEVLNENRDLIKKVVVETIREIQQKNKAKAQS